MRTINEQLEEMDSEWLTLVKALIPDIDDDCRASDDPSDNEPAMQLTIGFSPEGTDSDASWGFQTGDNSFTGGAYLHPFWAVVTLTRDVEPEFIVEEIKSQLLDLATS